MATTKKFRVKHGLDASNNTISYVGTPQVATDAANRQFVIDQVQSGIGSIANTSTSSVSWTKANNTLEFTRDDSSTFDVVLTDVGEVSNAYLTSTFTTNTDFQSFVANTNSYIETKADSSTVESYLANTNSYIATKTDETSFQSFVANTNSYIADVFNELQSTNTAVRSYVDTSIAQLVNSAPETLNTLDELAQALGDDPNLSSTLTTLIGTKASNTYVNTLLANTNSYIARVDLDLTSANVRIDTVISDLDAQELKQAQDLANTNAYIASVSDAQTQYLQVANVSSYIPANTGTSSATYTIANSTLTFTRADSSTFDVVIDSASVEVSNSAPQNANEGDMWWDNATGELFIYYANNWVEAVAQDVTPYANNGTFSASNNTITFVRTDGSQFDVVLTGVGEVTNTYVTSIFTTNAVFQSSLANTNAYIASVSDAQTQYLQVANTTALLSPYLEVANSTDFLVQSDVDQYLQVANVSSYGFATETYVDTAVAALVNTAPETLNTLDELAAALGDDANFATSVSTTLGTKASNSYVNTLLSNTNAYIASVSEAQTQYLQVANTAALVAPYLEVANSVNFLVQADVDQYLQVANLSSELADYWPSANVINYTAQYLEVANTTALVSPYLEVANVAGYGFATESYVDTSVAALVNAAPTTLNTLDELAQALGDDANYATTTATLIGTKASNTYVNTLLANTNSYIASVSDTQSQYLQVANSTNFLVQADVDQYLQVANVSSYIPANTSTTSASLSGNTVTFTRADSSTFDLDLSAFAPPESASVTVSNTAPTITADGDLWWDNATGELYVAYANNWVEAVAQDVTPYTNNASYSSGNSTLTFVRTDGSQYEVSLDLSSFGGGDVTNTYLTSTFTTNADFQSFVANTNPRFAQYLEVANSTNFLVQADVDKYLEVANANFATELYVDTAVAALVNSAPETLNTLDELAQALGDDANFATSVSTTLGTKASNTYVNTLLANTNAYIATKADSSALSVYLEVANSTNFLVQSDVDQYLQVANVAGYIPANTSTTSASLSGNTVTFTRADTTTFDLDLSGLSTGGGGGASLEVGNTAPVSPSEGDLWYDTDTGIINVYVGTAWAESTVSFPDSLVAFSNTAPSALTGKLWYDTDTARLFAYDGNAWIQVAEPFGSSGGTSGGITPGANAILNVVDANTVNTGVLTANDITVSANLNFSNNATLSWNTVEGTLDLSYDSVSLQIGQEQHYYAKATENINNGEVVMFAGVQGDHTLIAKANMNAVGFIPEYVMGVATQNILANEFGYVTSFGKVRGIDTRNYGAGSLLYLDPTTPGALSNTEPSFGGNNHSILLAASLNNTVDGTILVRPSHKLDIEELHGVEVTNKADGDVIVWNTSSGVWENSNAYATKTYVDTSVAALVNSAPETLNTLVELSNALGNDENYATTTATLIGTKASNTYVNTLLANTNAYIETKANTSMLSSYLEVANSTSFSSLSVQNTSPIGTTEGALWWDSDDLDLFIYYSNNWVKAVPADASPYTNNAVWTSSNNTISFTRTDNTVFTVTMTGLANTSYVDTAVAALVNAAPTTLNTLDELAQALGDDANYAATTAALIGTKASNTYVNTLLANTNAYIASVSTAQSQYLEVSNVTQYIPANTSTTSASLSGNTVTFTRADSSTYDLDLSTLSTGGSSVTISNTAPTPSTEGDLWFDETVAEMYILYANNWVQVSGSGGGAGGSSVTVANTAPTSPTEGDMYFDDELATLFIYYDSSWVEVQPSVSATSLTYNIDTYTANGSVTTFDHTGDVVDESAMIVTVDGVVQRPTTDYTVSGSTVTFTSAPADTSTVAIRITSGAYVADNTEYATTGKAIAMAIVFGG